MRILRTIIVIAALAISANAFAVNVGEKFPYQIINSFQIAPPRAPHLSATNLRDYAGRKAILLAYFIPNEAATEKEIVRLDELVQAYGIKKLQIFGVIYPNGKLTVEAAMKRATSLRLSFPILVDDGLKLGRVLGVQTAPAMMLIDRDGSIRFMNAQSLKQYTADRTATVETLLTRAFRGERVRTVSSFVGYSAMDELVGKRAFDFTLPRFPKSAPINLTKYRAGHPALIVFWSATCPHCLKEMPHINRYYQSFGRNVAVLTVTSAGTSYIESRIKEEVDKNRYTVPILIDRNADPISSKYMVGGVPAMVIIDRKGVVREVLVGEQQNTEAKLMRIFQNLK